MLVVVIAVVVWTLNLHSANSGFASNLSVQVPKVSGESYNQAKAELTKVKLEPSEQSETSQTVQQNVVIRTDPAAGAGVAPGQVVKVYVSIGPSAVSIPDVSGVSTTKAQSTLKEFGFVLGKTTKQDSPNIAKGVIISSTPPGGSQGTAGESVDIVVSTGLVTVPNVVNQSSKNAGSALAAIQLSVTVVGDSTCSGGKVTSQSLSPGKRPQHSKISITVCTG